MKRLLALVRSGFITVLAVGCVAAFGAKPLACSKPNIVVILADDLGYGDLTCYNAESRASTPNIDRLAASGVRFTDGHANAAVCTPSRYGILTGRYCWRTRKKSGVLNGFSPPLIAGRRETIASLVKAEGYNTACVGKWHLGMTWPRVKDGGKRRIDFTADIKDGPLDHGFDYYYGISASLDMPPYAWIENRRVTEIPTEKARPIRAEMIYMRAGPKAAGFKRENGLPGVMEKAVEYIAKQSKETPFLLYVPLPSPHKPVMPLERFKGTSKAGIYGDYVVETDWAVGRIINALKEKGFYENTLIIFSSDNGSFASNAKYGVVKYGHLPNGRLRGEKTDIWEGGHRVPFIVVWPSEVKAGQKYDGTVAITDIMATIADVIGVKLADTAGEDSWSFLPALKGMTAEGVEERAWVHHSGGRLLAIRKGKWKLIMGKGSGGRGGRGGADDPPGQLYDMEKDVGEKNNLFPQYPEMVKILAEELETIVANGRSTPGTKQPNSGKTECFSDEMKRYLDR